MPSPLDQFLRVPDAVPPKPVKPIDHYLKVTPSSSDNARVHIPDQRAPVKTAGQLIYESMPHQMEIDREPSVLEAILPRASRSSSDAPISGMANLALDVGGLAGRAIMSVAKPEGESYLHALARSEGTYDTNTAAGRVANTFEAMGRDPFNVLMAPVEQMMLKGAGLASKLHRPGEILEEKVAMKSGFIPPPPPPSSLDDVLLKKPVYIPYSAPKTERNPLGITLEQFNKGDHPPLFIEAPEHTKLPKGTLVGNPDLNRIPGTPQGDAYDRFMLGSIWEKENAPLLYRGGQANYNARDINQHSSVLNHPAVFSTDIKDMAATYQAGGDVHDYQAVLRKALEDPNYDPKTMSRTKMQELADMDMSKHRYDPLAMNDGIKIFDAVEKEGFTEPKQGIMYEGYYAPKNPLHIDYKGRSYWDDQIGQTNEDIMADAVERGHDYVIQHNRQDWADMSERGPGQVHIDVSDVPFKSKYNIGTWDLNTRDIYKILPFLGSGAVGGIIGAANNRQSWN